MWKYNLKQHTVDEQPTMDKPDMKDFHTEVGGFEFMNAMDAYEKHIASLHSILVQGKVLWQDGEDVTEWIIVAPIGFSKQKENLENEQAVFIPIKKNHCSGCFAPITEGTFFCIDCEPDIIKESGIITSKVMIRQCNTTHDGKGNVIIPEQDLFDWFGKGLHLHKYSQWDTI